MNLSDGRGAREDGFNLTGGTSQGPLKIVRAARDPVKFPNDPTIMKIVDDAMCIGSLGENCYVIKNVYGHSRTLPYGASLEAWRLMTQELLDMALAQVNKDLGI